MDDPNKDPSHKIRLVDRLTQVFAWFITAGIALLFLLVFFLALLFGFV